MTATVTVYKERVVPELGFLRDQPYTQDDIWNEGGVLKTFGHDPHTYPNQDNPQHYPEVQFAGDLGNNKNVVLQDQAKSRTEINDALRAVKDNSVGVFARDGVQTREALWDGIPVEPQGVTRTDRGLRQDLKDITSREGSWESAYEFEHRAGYLKDEIFGEVPAPVEPEEPKPVEPEPVEPTEPTEPTEPECPPGDECEPGTLNNALNAADKAEAKVDAIIAPVAPVAE